MKLQNIATQILQENIQYSMNKFLGKTKEVDDRILHKIRHTYGVLEEGHNMVLFDENLQNISQEYLDLCEVSTILHDVARFFQVNTERVLSHKEFEHGDIGRKMLEKTFFKDYPVVLLATQYHNKRFHNEMYLDSLYKSLNKDNQYLADLCLKYTRDADKLQNIKYFLVNVDHFLLLDSKRYTKEPVISQNIIEEFKNRISVDKKNIKTIADSLVCFAAWQFDLNFEGSKKILKSLNFEKHLSKVLIEKLKIDKYQVEQLFN